MKKRLIGCGVVAMLAIGGLVYTGWGLYPSVKSAFTAKEAYAQELLRLDEEHPFTPDPVDLDENRFRLSLTIRVELRESFQENLVELQEQELAVESEDIGFFDRFSATMELMKMHFELVGPTLDEIVRALDRSGMGPTEFAYYTRVLLAALARIDAGLGPADLEPLRGCYTRLKEEYPTRVPALEGERTSLDDLVGHVDHIVLTQAEEVLAAEPDVVMAGLTSVEYEFLYLGQLGLEDPKAAAGEPESDENP